MVVATSFVKPRSLKDLWVIDGKAYDMTSFKHPGGQEFLMVGQGRDCTELFKSVHVLSKVNFGLILSKYEVDNVELPEGKALDSMFDWSEKSQFWWELKKEVANYFEANSIHHKADWKFWVSCLIYALVLVQLTISWIQSASMSLAFSCGIMFGMTAFFFMHTGSHGALSFNSMINYSATVGWCHYAWWHGSLWLQHHVYGHHSFTGMLGKDPDVRNLNPVARKHPKQKPAALSKHQSWFPFIFLTLLPNQFVGQSIVYMYSLRRKRLFGMPVIMPDSQAVKDMALNLMAALSSFLLLVYPLCLHGAWFLPSLFMYWTGLGITYWAAVFPNHDTDGVLNQADVLEKIAETVPEKQWLKRDWGVLQLVHSSNFKLPGLLTQIFGGMNYQIEHHLFPSVHPIHYPALSRIVRRLANKYELPYLCYSSWFHALLAHWRMLASLATSSRRPSPVMRAA
eukprot:TRINITY_DN3559_c0_g2_i1.p1 TRINITY_DN3559_c0_g2~~TRINITY_DN3559_c0_g2_i1.p1  ORF type:complete len:454 (-),score=85.29 TRINITY_DN3559_c0_g2_i1:77-1438(-)